MKKLENAIFDSDNELDGGERIDGFLLRQDMFTPGISITRSAEFSGFRIVLIVDISPCVTLLYKIIPTMSAVSLFYNLFSRTSAVSSTNFRSILIFASCVVGTRNILYG